MSTFGSPGGRQIISKPNPPERGSFPLDHEAECQPIMKQYLRCLRSHRGINDDECRQLSKGYLQCRMDRNLMAQDSMRNLGYQEPEQQPPLKSDASTGRSDLLATSAEKPAEAAGK
ncbi:Cytochrome c oxidase assembly protein cox19 [Friedmanniomyces endolithicus]|uniref:Cytochrome C oxidase assembly protein COX19 n=1 Tax=Friedmanniomyces endolithicus TaxID=329885 RepID=A0A4U0UTS7_9PEZI|nr:Cytochrome c oxidase assembly protein cox19 [Friedmanniomyces endolithicus]KAK0273849.1 Cytochrome c oxidase assembly protein cox19 [Friedmanniomyces endolithicus]KAK0279890.1 Cytochrome c oxidase assembly protein cox19 [Friedmanniomyces endolithicus]KAK0305384.1 Cytochrome c oxidase assembly protein cox19 [Friedmanniomyces endolithicus]KAK0311005.1 Cytochrome c oxidase assembly protein cox19 [Friedmanniomyces endolithicus]